MGNPIAADGLARGRPGPRAALVVFIWFLTALYLGNAGAFASPVRIGPLHPVQAAIVGPIVVFFAAYLFVARFRRFIAQLDLVFLVGLQGVRVLALSHVNLWGYGLMAGGFALPVGLANLAVGLIALFTLPMVANRHAGWRAAVVVLSIVGLLEFAMTIGLAVFGFLSQPTLLDPPVAPGGYADFRYPPLGLFPTFAIPFLSLVHFTTLLRLAHEPWR